MIPLDVHAVFVHQQNHGDVAGWPSDCSESVIGPLKMGQLS